MIFFVVRDLKAFIIIIIWKEKFPCICCYHQPIWIITLSSSTFVIINITLSSSSSSSLSSSLSAFEAYEHAKWGKEIFEESQAFTTNYLWARTTCKWLWKEEQCKAVASNNSTAEGSVSSFMKWLDKVSFLFYFYGHIVISRLAYICPHKIQRIFLNSIYSWQFKATHCFN